MSEQLSDAHPPLQRIPIPPDSVVLPVPAEAFRPPTFLNKTAPPLVTELRGLFEELRDVHEEHLGEKVIEVGGYHWVTGMRDDLEERLRSWAERYFRPRATPEHLNPSVENDPFCSSRNSSGSARRFSAWA
jgi:hypothetical protein